MAFGCEFESLNLLAETEVSFFGYLINKIWIWGQVAIALGFVVFVHELGHFAAAKLFGVKVEKFYVGFDAPITIGGFTLPRSLLRFRYGETEYGIGVIPLGGYVKMLGQDDDPRNAAAENERIRAARTTDSNDQNAADGESNSRTDVSDIDLDDDLDGDAEGVGDFVLDPRSYPAKPVWQRMVIISAGVVMNIITGCMFAAIAFGYGVAYQPAAVGGVTPGGPAWESGIQPGGEITGVGDLDDGEHLRFITLKNEVVTHGLFSPQDPISLNLTYPGQQSKTIVVDTTPSPDRPRLRMVGIAPPRSTTVGAVMFGSAAAKVLDETDVNRRVLSADDLTFDKGDTADSIRLHSYLLKQSGQPVELKLSAVEKKDETRPSGEDAKQDDNADQPITVTLPVQKLKSLGFGFAVGPITSLRKGGPAETAGLKVDDLIVAVDGKEQLDRSRAHV
ncbi:MAG: site-2 protease family protein [Planctomycetota bacterium]